MSKKKKRSTPGWKKLLVIALASLTVGAGALAVKNINYLKGEKVKRVLDGDTFLLDSNQSIRLLGLDAPELGNCMSEEAKNALTKLIQGKRVQFREPVVDRYHRIMALVYTDTVLVNEVMIRGGFVQYIGQGGTQMPKLLEASNEARKNNVGIYSPACYQTEPPNESCSIKGNKDTTLNKKLYYPPGCPYSSKVIIMKFQGDQWFCSEDEAKKAGFIKADSCK
jgi:micrococcal nuclease